MRGGVRHRQEGDGIVKTTETVVRDFELKGKVAEESNSGSKYD